MSRGYEVYSLGRMFPTSPFLVYGIGIGIFSKSSTLRPLLASHFEFRRFGLDSAGYGKHQNCRFQAGCENFGIGFRVS